MARASSEETPDVSTIRIPRSLHLSSGHVGISVAKVGSLLATNVVIIPFSPLLESSGMAGLGQVRLGI